MKIFYKKKYKINSHPLAAHRVVNPALSSTHILLGLVDNYVFKYNYGYVFIISFYGNALLQCLCFIMPLWHPEHISFPFSSIWIFPTPIPTCPHPHKHPHPPYIGVFRGTPWWNLAWFPAPPEMWIFSKNISRSNSNVVMYKSSALETNWIETVILFG